MAVTNLSEAKIKENLRNGYMDKIRAMLENAGETVYRTGANTLHFLCEDDETGKFQMKLTFTIPIGDRETHECEDPSILAEEYARKQEEKAEKAKEAAEKKARKIAKDKADREAKANAKAKAEAEKGE